MKKPKMSQPVPLMPKPGTVPGAPAPERLRQGAEGLRQTGHRLGGWFRAAIEYGVLRPVELVRQVGHGIVRVGGPVLLGIARGCGHLLGGVRRLGNGAAALGASLIDRVITRWAPHPAGPTDSRGALVHRVGWYVVLWMRSRRLRHFLWGCPVLLVLLAAFCLALLARDVEPHELQFTYRLRAQQALAQRDFATVRLCGERLLQLGEDPSRACYLLAMAAEGAGQTEAAAALWEQIAPQDGLGFAPAHLNRARLLLREQGRSAAARRQAETHLLHVQKLVREAPQVGSEQGSDFQLRRLDMQAAVALGELYCQERRWEEAEQQLLRAIRHEQEQRAIDLDAPGDYAWQTADPQRVRDDNKARALLGRLYTQQKKYRQAESHLLSAVGRLTPDDPSWRAMYTLLGKIYVKSFLYEEGEEYLRKALTSPQAPEPVLVETYALLGEVHLFRERPAEAEAAFQQALAVPAPPQTATLEARVLLGQLYLAQRRLAAAEDQLQRGLALGKPEEPATVLAQALLGRLYLQLRRFPEAEANLKAAATTKLPDTPAQQEAQALLGQLYQTTGRPAQAVAALQAVVNERPEVNLALARALAAAGQTEQARDHARQAADYFRRRALGNHLNLEAHQFWAEALAFQGNYRQATRVLEEAAFDLQRYPAEAALASGELSGGVAYLWLSELLRQQRGQYRQTLARMNADWLAATQRNPTVSTVQKLILQERLLLLEPLDVQQAGYLLRMVQLTPAAAATEREAWQQALLSNQAPVLARLLLACDALNRRQPEEARPLLDQALERAPDVAIPLNNLAFLWGSLAAADTEKALVLMDAIVARQPEQPNFLDTRGQLLLKLGRWEDARRDLEKALPRIKNKKAVHAKLAQAYEKLGHAAQAAEHRRLAETQP